MARFDERDDIRERYGKPQRPAVQFTRRDDVRDLMKSPAGQNYGNMLDLQSQAIRHGGFDKGDPRVDELKAARRKYNRQDKYNIGNLMGYSPTDVQDIYRQNSGVLREHARPTYKQMYPISDIAHGVVGSGGLTGMLLNKAIGKSKKAGKNFFDDLRVMGSDILGGIGIGGAVSPNEATEEVLTNYADKTFGPYPTDIHPGLPIEDVTETEIDETFVAPPQEQVDVVDDITVTDIDSDLPFHSRRSMFPRDNKRVIPGYTTSYVDSVVDEPTVYEAPVGPEVVPPIPFDDSNREAGIASLYGQGPKWGGTNRRYEDEYRDYVERIGNMVGGPMTYEEFSEAWEGIHQGKPHAGLR